MAKSIKRNLIKVLLAVLLPALLTVSLVSYAPVPVFKMQEANALAPIKMLLAAAGASSEEPAASYDFDGNNDYLSIPSDASFGIGTGVFSVTFWLYPDRFQNNYDEYFSIGSGVNFFLYHWRSGLNSGQMQCAVGSTEYMLTYIPNVLDTWVYCELTRDSSDNLYFFADGVEQTGVIAGVTGSISAGEFRMADSDQTGDELDGKMDAFELRNVVGNTTNYTPPTEAPTADGNSLILINCNEVIVTGTTGSGATAVELGTNSLTYTENGNAIRNTSIKKF